MKKIISLLSLIFVCFSICAILSACEMPGSHSHTYKNEWENDSTHHWHACEDTKCDVISDKTEHSFIDGVCVCGYKKINTCVFDTEWSKDATEHWHSCKNDDCDEIADKSAHTWNSGAIITPATKEADGVKEFTCTVCGQTKTESVEFDVWASYFDYESIKNATVTSVQTDVTNDIVTNTNIKIDGDRWERLVADFSYNYQYYKTCIVYFDGEKTYLNGEESDCPVFKDAFFSFIDFSQKGDLFTETEEGRYEIGENTYTLYGFTVSNVVIIIENDNVTYISMTCTMGVSVLTLEYNFFDYGTTVIEGLTSGT